MVATTAVKYDTVFLAYGSLQVLPWNNNTITEKINGGNRCLQITDFIQYIHSSNQGGIIIINYISFLQLFLCKKIANLKECVAAIVLYNRRRVIHQMGGCNWNCELTRTLSNSAPAPSHSHPLPFISTHLHPPKIFSHPPPPTQNNPHSFKIMPTDCLPHKIWSNKPQLLKLHFDHEVM